MKIKYPKSPVFKIGAVCLLFFCFVAFYLVMASNFDRRDLAFPDNLQFVDRTGALLRFIPDDKGERHTWVSGENISQVVKDAFIAAEDQRFYLHTGFDVPAILRAVKDNYSAGRIVSGASTITQQTVRLVYNSEFRGAHKRRSYRRKLIEVLRAARMELSLSKAEILEQYLNRVPMGNNIVGVELGARTYFGKSVADLNVGEAAVLAAIPKAPGVLNPYGGNLDRLNERKDWVLLQMAQAGFISDAEHAAFKDKIATFRSPYFPNKAPHLVDMLVKKGLKQEGTVVTSIDVEIQSTVEQILASHAERLKYGGGRQAAAMIVRNNDMNVMATAGSLEYGRVNGGYNNGTTALRSAGSTLKPFLYAQALDDGFKVTWAIEDTLKKYRTPAGDYVPANFDKKYYGPVTMRTALGNSLNLSAIKMLEAVGQQRYFSLLYELGFINDPSKTSEHYGLGLVVGNPEVTLEELVRAYAMLSSGGVLRDLAYVRSKERAPLHFVFSPEASYIITDILSDPSARFMTFGGAGSMKYPFRVSIKTGTSTNYRDAWAIGYTPEYTVGVWVGNFEGDPTYGISGAKGATPILHDIFEYLYKEKTPSLRDVPEGVVSARVCGISGMKPGPHCKNTTVELFKKENLPNELCTYHTSDDNLHKLPAIYTQWVYDKKKAGLAGSFSISGLTGELDRPDSEELPEEKNFRVDKSGHYTIGTAGAPRNVNGALRYDVSITYPLNNDVFVLDRRNDGQTVTLEASTDRPVKYVKWYIDGKFYKKVAPAYRAAWRPERGWHTISVISPDNMGDSIKIRVE